MRRLFYIIAVAVAVALLSGCVYYNTFFLAKKNYRQAEKIREKAGGDVLPGDAAAKYQKAIEKCQKVLTYYPDSKYVDDALFLLGMCYVRTGDYTKALRKFNELLTNYPESEFAEDARYWRNVCLYYGGKEDLAVDSLKALAEQDPKRAEEAMFMIGELAYQKKNYIEAKSAFLDFLREFPKSSLVGKAHLRLGQIEWHFEEYTAAAEHLEKVKEGDVPVEDFFTAQKLLIQCYIKIGRLDDADALIKKLLKDETYAKHWPELELLSGDVLYARGRRQEAMDIWNSLIDRYPRTAVAAWAYYKLGEAYYDIGDLQKALEMFTTASKTGDDPEVKELARKRKEQIEKMLQYKDIIKNSDSPHDVVKAQLSLAELYLTELNQPDSAISAYQQILEKYPNDSLAPKAAYSLGWVWANKKKNYDKADTIFAELLKKYPNSDYAAGAAEYFKSRGGSLDSLASKNVEYYFVKAEEFWLTYGYLDSALYYYQLVIDSFPNSQWTPKAMAARAEILADMGRVDEAKQLYAKISERFPGTPYDSLAKVRLGRAKVEVARRTKKPTSGERHYASADSSKNSSTQPDTIRGTIDNLPRAPRPIKRILLFYPEQEWSSRLQGKKVRIKIKIDPFGKVTDAQLLMSCGNPVIDEAALMAVKKAEFDPSQIDITLFNKWMLIEIPVTKPARASDWDMQ